mmetsp:Transcript_17649/g.66661  ORF Transcript_17649/g.66661 Transcript_17649/m.66661 type:complete len:285 (+) Transcript_17649:1342-2196(+)
MRASGLATSTARRACPRPSRPRTPGRGGASARPPPEDLALGDLLRLTLRARRRSVRPGGATTPAALPPAHGPDARALQFAERSLASRVWLQARWRPPRRWLQRTPSECGRQERPRRRRGWRRQGPLRPSPSPAPARRSLPARAGRQTSPRRSSARCGDGRRRGAGGPPRQRRPSSGVWSCRGRIQTWSRRFALMASTWTRSLLRWRRCLPRPPTTPTVKEWSVPALPPPAVLGQLQSRPVAGQGRPSGSAKPRGPCTRPHQREARLAAPAPHLAMIRDPSRSRS